MRVAGGSLSRLGGLAQPDGAVRTVRDVRMLGNVSAGARPRDSLALEILLEPRRDAVGREAVRFIFKPGARRDRAPDEFRRARVPRGRVRRPAAPRRCPFRILRPALRRRRGHADRGRRASNGAEDKQPAGPGRHADPAAARPHRHRRDRRAPRHRRDAASTPGTPPTTSGRSAISTGRGRRPTTPRSPIASSVAGARTGRRFATASSEARRGRLPQHQPQARRGTGCR